MDIGINSLRNLRFLNRWRIFLWLGFFLTSVPLHLLFSASVFATATSTEYNQIVTNQAFLNGANYTLPGVSLLAEPFQPGAAQASLQYIAKLQNTVSAIQAGVSSFRWKRLESVNCRQTYLAQPNGLQHYRNLVIVIEAGPKPTVPGWTGSQVWGNTLPPYMINTTVLSYDANASSSLWSYSLGCSIQNNLGNLWNYCSDDFGYNTAESQLPSWSDFSSPWQFPWVVAADDYRETYGNFSAAYNNVTLLFCMAEPFESPCKVEVLNQLLLAVAILLLIKTTLAGITLWMLWSTKPILCLGDAIQMFFEQAADGAEDKTTRQLSTCGQSDFVSRRVRSDRQRPPNNDMRVRWTAQPRRWAATTKRWFDVVPAKVWVSTYGPIAVVLVIALALLDMGIRANAYANRGPFYEAGFGSNPMNHKVHITGDVYWLAIVANSPQLVLTTCFFLFSSLYVRLFQGAEWASFADGRPPRLRVTVPEDDCQESAPLLKVPLAWGLVFRLCSLALSILASQSLFVAAVEMLAADDTGSTPGIDVYYEPLSFAVVFSSEALLASIVVGLTTIAVPLCLGFFRLPSNSIIVGSNSAAISAQCHPVESRRDGSGVEAVERERGEEANSGGVGREEGEDGHERRSIRRSGDEPEDLVRLQRVQWAADREEGEDSHETRVIHRFDNDPENRVWLQRMQWGVLVRGGGVPEEAGQLGLGSVKSIVEKPAASFYG
ncbi:hypothetical protein CONLIGDRAFT_212838 [Coniochaeta ligniaria NRRL 30616]|uniref:DUF6536 domain-containing protein n=1 Tax=Coniochaeta ligniaria NRRL 30616 TaxID=1408157 RepID=A0A1J7J3Z9_9PEZI|nr:hypothetical protein CONLIGDRAFT_212838 [Coniochaeta ligniaria NRRL 30616]